MSLRIAVARQAMMIEVGLPLEAPSLLLATTSTHLRRAPFACLLLAPFA
jgi:hypothetical protein